MINDQENQRNTKDSRKMKLNERKNHNLRGIDLNTAHMSNNLVTHSKIESQLYKSNQNINNSKNDEVNEDVPLDNITSPNQIYNNKQKIDKSHVGNSINNSYSFKENQIDDKGKSFKSKKIQLRMDLK